MGLLNWLKGRVDRDARHLVYAPIPAARALAAPDPDLPIRPREDYVRLWLTEMFLKKDRAWFSEWHPAVHALTRFQYGDGEVELPYIAGPLKLPDMAEANVGRVLHLNHALTPLVPFNGGSLEVAAGLLAMKGRNDIAVLIGALGRFADLLQVPQLSTALDVAAPLASAVEDLLGATDGALHLGLHQTFVADGGGGANGLRAGYVAVVLADEGTLDPSELWVAEDRLRRGPSAAQSRPLDGFTYMLFRIERREERSSWSGLAAIDKPFREAAEAFQAGDPALGRTRMKQAIFAAAGSPDLTWPDRRRVATRLQEELAYFESLVGALGGEALKRTSHAFEADLASAERSLDALRDDHVLPLATARALGPVDPGRLPPTDGAEPPAGLAPLFEAFAIETAAPTDPAAVAALVAPALGPDWVAEPYRDDGRHFELTRPATPLAEAEAWERTYALRATPGVAYAEPLFVVSVYEDPEALQPSSPFEAAEGERPHLPGSDDPDWALDQLRVRQAWALFDDGTPPGSGIVVGHPDTGYRRHPEIDANLLVDLGYDFVRGDRDAEDELDDGVGTNPSHGVSTSSVIISKDGPQADFGADDPRKRAVSGVAPGARLIPIRTARTVALLSTRRLARAIEYAVDRGAHVISISMGGVRSRRLREAVRYAETQGVIVCAAAGNQVRMVVWPARYEEVVACAACNVERGPWVGSSRGQTVTVSAPGESVWRARTEPATDGVTHVVGRGSGTSYAVAHVAGLASLWLSYHGRAALLDRYGPGRLPSVFRHLLMATADPAADLSSLFGAGIANAERLLTQPLPAPASPFEAAESLDEVPPEADPMAEAAGLFDLAPSAPAGPFEAQASDRLAPTLAALLGVAPEAVPVALEDVGDELLFHLITRPHDYDRLKAALVTPAPASPFESDQGADPRVAQVRADLRSPARSARLRALLTAD